MKKESVLHFISLVVILVATTIMATYNVRRETADSYQVELPEEIMAGEIGDKLVIESIDVVNRKISLGFDNNVSHTAKSDQELFDFYQRVHSDWTPEQVEEYLFSSN